MSLRRVIPGILLLLVGALLVFQALGPYARFSASFLMGSPIFVGFFLVVGAVMALIGLDLLIRKPSGVDGPASRDEMYYLRRHRPPIVAPLLPLTSSGSRSNTVGGRASVIGRDPSETNREEPD